MKKLIICLFLIITNYCVMAQPGNRSVDTSWKKQYRETATKINDLVHTRLDARFDFDKSYMYGRVWITLKPHFYPTDSLRLDAKGMHMAPEPIPGKWTFLTHLIFSLWGWETMQLSKIHTKEKK